MDDGWRHLTRVAGVLGVGLLTGLAAVAGVALIGVTDTASAQPGNQVQELGPASGNAPAQSGEQSASTAKPEQEVPAPDPDRVSDQEPQAPSGAPAAPAAPAAPDVTGDQEPASESPASTRYDIEPGQTLSGISRSTGVSVDRLAEVNSIRDVDVVYGGSTLEVPAD